MATPDNVVSLTARYVFPVAGPPLAGGAVTIRGERIVAVEPTPPVGALDLGDVAILPGLVNAHTHLEFSECAAPLGTAGMSLPDWIRLVVASRRDAGDPRARIAAGLAESLRQGTCALGEIATSGWTEDSINTAPLDLTAFYELIGLRADRADERLAAAEEFIANTTAATPGHHWQAGISPHAPYSVHPELVVGLVRLAARHHLPVAMHLAESREELTLLTDGRGPFRDMLEAFDAWDETAIPHGTRPLEYLQLLAQAPRALVIHGNYLAADELEFLALQSDRMSLVYCPRTHFYFGHELHPLEKLLALGATVALGTDSRASNPDLSVLAEMRHVARRHRSISTELVLSLGTLAGARALGRGQDVGTLDAGKLANLAIVPVAARSPADPHELLFESDEPVSAVWYRGRQVTVGNS